MSRRGATALAGVLAVDKPAGMTSHDVVAAVRRATGEGRVGHAGTLDPAATGLLVVLLGRYTRLARYLSAAVKGYEATITFGSATDTDDAEGQTVAEAAVPPEVADPGYARGVLASFLGESSQQPPSYSAIKVGGKVAHRAARAGEALEVAPRDIVVKRAELLSVGEQPSTWTVDLLVSKGTYVRALARDIGVACGTVAHLSALRRTLSGVLSVQDAHTLADVAAAAVAGDLPSLFADPLKALGLPPLEADGADVGAGRAIPAPEAGAPEEGAAVAVTVDGKLAAVYRRSGDTLVPETVLTGGGAA